MYKVFIETRFSAAHRINGYPGHCGKIHGHTWKVRVTVISQGLDEIGISLDFKELRRLTEVILERVDHEFINEVAPFNCENPTAENLAKYIYHELIAVLPESIEISDVTVWESDNYAVTYSEP